MGENRQKNLLQYMVKENGKWIKAQQLADLLNVSTRQIRKYITAINESCQEFSPIESGPKGYRLDSEKYFPYKEAVDRQAADTPQMRQNYMLQKLITLKEGYDIFDFEEELCVSMATIENDLKNVRKSLDGFGLCLKRNKDILSVEGAEQNKRRLMHNMILPGSSDFALNDEIQLLTFHYHFWDFRKNIWRILVEENDMFSNDYTLNNIALHVIVMIDRIRSGAILENEGLDLAPYRDTEQFRASEALADYLCHTYEISMNDAELYQLFVTVSNNTTVIDHTSVNIENISQFVDPFYIDITEHVLHQVEETYYLDPFDDAFKTSFIIHVNNLFNRMKCQYTVRNPLTFKLKGTYPLIYDISVYIAQEFETDYGIHLSEDEIAFIALHIGGYFENNLQNKHKVSCIFIYEDYYGNYKKTLEKISITFADSLNIRQIVTLNQFRQEHLSADLIISTADLELSERHVIINPILTNENLEKIRLHVEHIQERNRNSALKIYLSCFVDSRLFYKNPRFADRRDAIEQMTQNAISLGLAKESLTENVLQRENLSDTGFHAVAVPHSLHEDVVKSFISFAILDTPMPWGDKQVYIIALIGVNRDSRKAFTEVFDFLVDVLSEMQNVKELSVSADYNDFLGRLTTRLDSK